MLDNDFASRLEQAPPPEDAINELFGAATKVSEARTFLSVIDFEISTHDGKNYLTCEMTRHSMIQQFAEYFSRVIQSPEEFDNAEDANVSRRLQMLAYCQFWECLGIQRMLLQIVGIANGEHYESRLLLDKRPSTYKSFKRIRSLCCSSELKLEVFLEAVYSNQIRNAFSHSEMWMLLDYVTFQNYDPTHPNHVASLKFETWKMLFQVTSDFIISLFKTRRKLEAELKSKMPYRVDLPEFKGPFTLLKDERGYWSARPTR